MSLLLSACDSLKNFILREGFKGEDLCPLQINSGIATEKTLSCFCEEGFCRMDGRDPYAYCDEKSPILANEVNETECVPNATRKERSHCRRKSCTEDDVCYVSFGSSGCECDEGFCNKRNTCVPFIASTPKDNGMSERMRDDSGEDPIF